VNKELAKKPQKFFSKSTVVFNDELEFVPSGVPESREKIRETAGVQSIKLGIGIGYQEIGKNNKIG
jgi:hypothetical protein